MTFRPSAEPHRTLYNALVEQQKQRDSDPDWVNNERRAIWNAAINYANDRGLHIPSLEEVCRAERMACGHVDYPAKFAYGIGHFLNSEDCYV